ncbi:MAG: hypothetical protein Q4P14_00995 [Methanobacteriaceae archaeon]|nr:hypothetical protein [Methanobacteriaceae archaeon]
MSNDKGMLVLTSLVAVGIFVVALIAAYLQSIVVWPLVVIGLIFIPFILLQDRVKYANLAEKLEHLAFFITLAVIIVGFLIVYTPV